MDASRPADPAEMATMAQAAQTYLGAAMALGRSVYGPEFDAWPEDGRHACAIVMAVQAILTPEAFAAPLINFDVAAHAIGIALGTQTANLSRDQMHVVLARFSTAFASGRAQSNAAAFNMKTEGTA